MQNIHVSLAELTLSWPQTDSPGIMRKGAAMRFSYREMLALTLRRSLVVIAVILAITLFFAWQARHLTFKTSIYDLEIERSIKGK